MSVQLTETQFQTASAPEELAEARILNGFDAASPELLAARALQKRVDTKFVVSRAVVGPLLEALRSDFQVVLSNGQPSATYETLYYDTENLDLYHAHRRGIRPRAKVRVRHYVERNLCFLEIKQKDRYDVTAKTRVPRAPHAFGLTDDDRALIANVVGTDAPFVPECWVHFPRVTLVGTHHEERLTLDLGLRFDEDSGRAEFDGAVIAEIKQPRFSPRSPAMQVFRSFGIRPASMSKYCVGVALLSDVRANHRFRPAIRELRRQAA